MTEAEWSVCENPTVMLLYLEQETAASDRKIRLFECACARRVWHRVNDERLDRVLLGMESFADGLLSARELEPLHDLAWEVEGDDGAPAGSQCIAYELGIASRVKRPNPVFMGDGPIHTFSGRSSAVLAASGSSGREEFELAKKAERKQQTVLLRDIFGSPFRPVTFTPGWRTDTALALARPMYESRDFGAMPLLADALQDAGCDNDDILDHCRDAATTHVRGCWVVDLVLGKQ